MKLITGESPDHIFEGQSSPKLTFILLYHNSTDMILCKIFLGIPKAMYTIKTKKYKRESRRIKKDRADNRWGKLVYTM